MTLFYERKSLPFFFTESLFFITIFLMHWLRDIIFIILLLGCDLILKYLIYDLWWRQDSLRLTNVFNTGISRWLPISYRIVIPISLIAIMFFSYQYSMRNLTSWAFVPFVAGAFGNLIDRIRLWWVRDFIDISSIIPSFPIFNLADMLINIGVLLLIRWTIRSDSEVAHTESTS